MPHPRAIAWIGSAFFIALDLGCAMSPTCRPARMGRNGASLAAASTTSSSTWSRPSGYPEHLTWFRRESHATWLSGFALLAIVYRAGAELFLIDRTVAVLAPLPVIAITLASEIIEWYRAAVASWALSNLRRRRLRSVSGSLDQKA